MEILVKIRFGASKEKFETYGGNRYLIYLPFEEDSDSKRIIVSLISRHVGVHPNKIIFKQKDAMGNWLFELS